MTHLSAGQVDAFRRDGVLFPVPAIAAAEAAQGLARLEAMEAQRAGRLPPSMNAKPHLLVPWLWDLVHDPRIVDAVEGLMGPDLLCWGSSFIAKRPGDARYVAWHQDATYWGLSEPRAVTAWVALTSSDTANGCVRMLPGSHRQVHPHVDTRDPKSLLGRRERVLADIDETTAVDVVLQPGEMSLHDILVIHGSEASRAGGRRVGFAIRYIPGHLHQADGARNFATLVRGRDHGHFDLEQAPEGEFHPAAVARHSLVLRRAMGVIFAGGSR